jgi:hypothetical protein
MRQERLLLVGTNGGGYINLCTNKDDLSLDLTQDCVVLAKYLRPMTCPLGVWKALLLPRGRDRLMLASVGIGHQNSPLFAMYLSVGADGGGYTI